MKKTDLYCNVHQSRLLIVDDQKANLLAMERILHRSGYLNCHLESDPHRVVERFAEVQPDLLVLDWHMPALSGLEVLRAVRASLGDREMPPVLVLTADTCPDTKREALEEGATDFLSKPVDQTEMLLRLRNLLRLRKLHLESLAANNRLELQVHDRTQQLESALHELREMQQHSIQQERLHALGTMAAGIAHDFNNVLMIIRGYSELFVDQAHLCRDSRRVREAFSTIDSASSHAADIVRRLREFYRPFRKEEEDRQLINLNDLVEEVARLAQPRWQTQPQAKGISIQLHTQLQTVPLVSAAGAELREVLLNLIFNAVDAMPEGGQICLRTGVEGDSHVFFEVEDSGTGMSEQTRRRCLEPFFTTKGEDGTGLGLAITYGIIRRHHGLIRINSEVEEGTQVSVLLPVAPANAVLQESPMRALTLPPMRILVVDDQPGICNVLSQHLARDGHVVAIADSGSEALTQLRGAEFDLVITDRAMPGMNGVQLASAIKAMSPMMPVLMLTACVEEIDPETDCVDAVLRKPATLQNIREALGRVIQPSPHTCLIKVAA